MKSLNKMSASLYVSDNSKHLGGEIKLQKNDGKVTVSESNISKVITGKVDPVGPRHTLEGLIESIEDVVAQMCFTSRYIGQDMFTKEKYPESCEDLVSRYMYGIQSIYEIPAGMVIYHTSNFHLYTCSVIELMLQDNIIPFTYTNICEETIYKVKRSDGNVQDCVLIDNGAITTNSNNNELYILNSFREYEDYKAGVELYPGHYSDLRKSVKLSQFQDINDLKTEIKLPYFSEKEIVEATPLNKELFYYYNRKLKHFENKLKENYEYITFK